MPTYDASEGYGLGVPIRGQRVYAKKQLIDMAKAANGNAPVASDIIKVFKVPKGSVVLAYGLIPKRVGAGTAVTFTFGVTANKGATIAGTAAIVAATTPMALGVIAPATLTTPLINAKAAESDDEDVFLTVAMTTLTAVTDLGEQEFYVVLADLN